MNVLRAPAAERECHRSVALANQIRPDAGPNSSARPEQERLGPNDLLCFMIAFRVLRGVHSLSLQHCDALQSSLCHHGRIARENYTNHNYCIHCSSTSILYKMSASKEQEVVSATTGDDPAKVEEEEDTTVYPKGIQFVMLMASFYLGVFMVSLVRHLHRSTDCAICLEGTTS